jgi:carbonic anhydrase
MAGAAAQEEVEFSYSGDFGPGFWGNLVPEWVSCSEDERQSPIAIDEARRDATLEPLDLELQPTTINLTNNGHTIQQTYPPGSILDFEGVKYTLSQFHFHTLSEHTIDGKRGVMELHAVFDDATGTGNKAVIGQLYEIGEENAFLAQFDQILPEKSGKVVAPPETEINLADGLKNTKRYYTYPGSLTTPPCSPVVTWIVLKKWATLSEEQFRLFNDVLGHNFRPLQELNGRIIRLSTHVPQ